MTKRSQPCSVVVPNCRMVLLGAASVRGEDTHKSDVGTNTRHSGQKQYSSCSNDNKNVGLLLRLIQKLVQLR